jgi:hypothetical protein
MGTDPKQCRERALRCAELAERATDPTVKVILTDLADWASGHNGEIKRAVYGYEATREAAMGAFAKSWRYENHQRELTDRKP